MTTYKTYDYIIYSANLAGIITALDLSRRGMTVLLLNFYGFMGGSLTESLNCLQSLKDLQLKDTTKEIVERIKSEKQGILFQYDNEILLNSETVKMVLQKLIEKSKIDLLFHIVPFYLKQQKDYIEFLITGKEGVFRVKGKAVIDTSEEYDLLKLENCKRNLTELYFNMFLTGFKNDSWKQHNLINHSIKLNDGRCWVSLKLPKPENEFFIENNSQQIINEFEEVVQKNGGRIQLIAPQTQKIYNVDKKRTSNNFYHLESLLTKNYSHKELFIQTSDLESKLSMLK